MDSRFERAVAAFSTIHAADPKSRDDGRGARPMELVEVERRQHWVSRLCALRGREAGLALSLAVHCQHLERWAIPRESRPMTRPGYLQWRRDLAAHHAERASAILAEVGYESTIIEEVRAILLKQGLGADSDSQLMEDALCLSFLQHEALDFAAPHPPEKVLAIVRKTWRKLSDVGRSEARRLVVPEPLASLLAAVASE